MPESKGPDTTTVNIFKRWRSGQKSDRSPKYYTGRCSILLLPVQTLIVSFFIEDHLSTVAADEREIRQVFGNILSNAREAMMSGGSLTISVENVTASPKDELPLLERNYVRVSIEDTGSGIPKNYLQRIFDPYFTTKPLGVQKGMGLGLAICYSIVKKHEGFLDVQSTWGREPRLASISRFSRRRPFITVLNIN